jgi:hypothetical protein
MKARLPLKCRFRMKPLLPDHGPVVVPLARRPCLEVVMPQKRFFHFSYPSTVHNPRYEVDPRSPHGERDNNEYVLRWDRDLHRVRDASPLLELSDVIHGAGYDFGDTILNLSWGPLDGVPPDHISAVPALKKSDLLVATTRCPLNDKDVLGAGRKLIEPSRTPLEDQVFTTLRECFVEGCDRATVKLRRDLRVCARAAGLPAKQFPFSTTTALMRRVKGRFTMGFLFYAPHLLSRVGKDRPWEQSGPGLLLSFGMAGVENWLWTRALRRSHHVLLKKIVGSKKFWVVMGKWKLPTRPEGRERLLSARPMTLAEAGTMDIDLVVLTASAPYKGARPGTQTPWHRLK